MLSCTTRQRRMEAETFEFVGERVKRTVVVGDVGYQRKLARPAAIVVNTFIVSTLASPSAETAQLAEPTHGKSLAHRRSKIFQLFARVRSSNGRKYTTHIAYSLSNFGPVLLTYQRFFNYISSFTFGNLSSSSFFRLRQKIETRTLISLGEGK